MGRTKTFVREDVLDAATQIFWEKGFADTSLSDLEKATGVNKSGLYSEFKDKEDIYFECLKRYRNVHPSYQILSTSPMGWTNIENFFKANMTCKGKKGCFISNSIREHAIIPQKAKKLMAENSALMDELVEKNLKAAGIKRDVAVQARLISTFAAGISLKLNAMKPEELEEEIGSFLTLLKNS
jgi:AcrR family transcriptional regulator